MNQNIDFIPFSKPSIDSEEEQAVLNVLRSGWLTTGEVTAKFEKEFEAFLGVKHAIALNSATAGLHLSLEAIGVKKQSYVITTPYSFAASSEIIRYMEAYPLFVDIEERTFNINPDLIVKELNKNSNKISAILPVHIAGLPCKMDQILEISNIYQIPVVEDAAHAFPVRFGNRFAGTMGKTGVFSFYANKTITTGEGGMVVTMDKDIAKRIKIMRLHGIDRETWDRYNSPSASWYYDVVAAGFKYNLTDLASSIGRVQLKKAWAFLEKRKKIAQAYISGLSNYDFFKVPEYTEEHAWYLFIIRVCEDKLTITRDEFMKQLQNEKIGTSVHFIPLHTMSYYKSKYNYKDEMFPISLKNYYSSISIPIYPNLTDEQVNRIIQALLKIGKKFYKKLI